MLWAHVDAVEGPIHAAMPMLVRGMRVVVRGVVSPDGAQVLPLEPQPRTAARPGFLAVDGEVWRLTGTHVQVLPSKLTLLGVGGADA